MAKVIYIAFIVMGILSLASPETIWEINEKWRTQGGDGPSAFYAATTRVGGALFIVLGIYLLIFH